MKLDDLPRQARDKYEENSHKPAAFPFHLMQELFYRVMHSRIKDQDAYDWIVKDPTIDSPERGEFEKLSTFKMKQWYVLDARLLCLLQDLRPR